jgi:hypothetical protein
MFPFSGHLHPRLAGGGPIRRGRGKGAEGGGLAPTLGAIPSTSSLMVCISVAADENFVAPVLRSSLSFSFFPPITIVFLS